MSRSAQASPARRCLAASLFLACSLASLPIVHAAPEVPSAGGAEADAGRGRFADIWRASGKKSAKSKPYAPIDAASELGLIPEIDMFVGETRVFPAPGVARIAVGNGRIMEAAALDDKEVIVFANGVGTSSLFIWNSDGRYQRVKINIVAGDTSRFAREIAAFLSNIPNAKASVIGDKVIVEGEDLSDLDLAKIEELAKRYPQVVNFTNPLGWDQMVLMDVKIVEFPRNELREIGLKWGAVGGVAVGGIWAPVLHGKNLSEYQINLGTGSGNTAPITAANGGSSIPLHAAPNILSMVNMGLNAQLALLAQEGKAAILAEPQLSARNGSEATFLAGGEYPYPISTINGTTVVFKPFGVRLAIKPQVGKNGIIRATIDSEVSAIDASVSTIAGPGLSSRRTTTEFNVRNGETLVLGGLLTRKNSVSIDKVPFLGDVPVIGALFRSKRFQNDETELVVFVTPHIVHSRSRGLVDRVEDATRRLERATGRPPYLNAPNESLHGPVALQGEPAPDEGASGPATTPAASASSPAPQPVASDTDERVPINRRVLGDGATVFALPNRASPLLARLSKDAVVASGSAEMVGGWREVRLSDGRSGWIGDRLVTPTADAPTSIPATGEAPAVEAARPAIGGGVGSPAAVRPVTPPSSPGNSPARWYRTTRDQVAMRVSPDVNAQKIASLPFAMEVEALADRTEEGWMPVRTGSRTGWVRVQSLTPLSPEEP